MSGGLPIKLVHGNVNLKIKWDIEPEDLNYNPLILICFEGLVELTHPYHFLAKQSCIDLLKASNSRNKIKELNFLRIFDPSSCHEQV